MCVCVCVCLCVCVCVCLCVCVCVCLCALGFWQSQEGISQGRIRWDTGHLDLGKRAAVVTVTNTTTQGFIFKLSGWKGLRCAPGSLHYWSAALWMLEFAPKIS
jgi:hypothetical protein